MKKLFYIILLFALVSISNAQTISIDSFDGYSNLVVNQFGSWSIIYKVTQNTTVRVVMDYSNGVKDSVDQIVLANNQYLTQFSRSFPQPGVYLLTCHIKIGNLILGTRQKTVTVSGLTDVENDNIPIGYSLSQNYPNPFNPTSLIAYSIPAESHVKITFFDVTGREIGSPVNEIQPAGNYGLPINFTNMPSGIYFYRLQTIAFTQTKKMVLMK